MPKIDFEFLNKITRLIYQRYDYDFRNYALAPLQRRLQRILSLKNLSSKELLAKLELPIFFKQEFLEEIPVRITEMFRDPEFWKTLRNTTIPALVNKKDNLNVWLAGCASGEEVLSLSILLYEAGLLNRTKLIGSDINYLNLQRMKEGKYSIDQIKASEKNYELSGGRKNLTDYYKKLYQTAEFNKELLDCVTYVEQDLVTDAPPPPGMFDLIICRNVLIYFNKDLQNQVINKFHNSLKQDGVLAIGSNESLLWFEKQKYFKPVSKEKKIFQLVKLPFE